VAALLVVGEFGRGDDAGAAAADGAGGAGGCGGFAVYQGVEEGGEEVGEGGCFGVVVWAVGEAGGGLVMGGQEEVEGTGGSYCSSSSARLSGPLAYCCSSSSMASTSGDLARLVRLMLTDVARSSLTA